MTLLFVNHYRDKDNIRNSELETCLRNNINNPLIDVIYLVAEEPVADLPDKCRTIVFEGRPTYSQFFEWINERANEDDISIISNSDIYFDSTISLAKSMGEEDCYALSRWNVLENGGSEHFFRRDSQDVWIFKGKVKWPVAANFTLGVAGCDNVVIYLLQQAGYKVFNPSIDIKTHHLHLTDIRYYSPTDRVPSPYLLIQPHHINNKDPEIWVI